MFGVILKVRKSSFHKGMTFCRSIYVKKVMKLLAFIFEQPSYGITALQIASVALCSEIQNQLVGLLINVQLCPLKMSSLKNMCFQINMCAETNLWEFAISLELVILCESVNVETESRNFLALKAQGVYRMAIKQSSLFHYSCPHAYK